MAQWRSADRRTRNSHRSRAFTASEGRKGTGRSSGEVLLARRLHQRLPHQPLRRKRLFLGAHHDADRAGGGAAPVQTGVPGLTLMRAPRVTELERQVEQLQGRLEQAAPALELADRNAELEAQLEARQAELQQSLKAYDAEVARQRTLITGAALVGGGIVFGLLLPMLTRGRKRRGYGDL